MEIKILCNCGTKYRLEFEPVDGRVPFAVICPTCGIDATEYANAHVLPSSVAPAPAPVAQTAAAAPAPVKPGLRIRTQESASVPGAPPVSAPPSAPASAPAPARRRVAAPVGVTPYAPPDEGLSSKFLLGLGGALLGVIAGCALWYLFFHLTGKNYRIAALMVGIAAGFGAKLFSKDEGSTQLGIITATFVFVGIIFTAYSIGRDTVHGYVGGFEGEFYEEERDYAKRAVAATPNGTDEEIRLFLAREDAWEGETPNPAAVHPDEVRSFREVWLPFYKELAAGKISKDEFIKSWPRLGFDEEVAQAKYTLAAMPDESDAEIRRYLAEEYAEYGEKPDLRSISPEEIAEFRTEVLPELKALASGETTFEESMEDYKSAEQALDEFEKTEEGGWMKFIYFFAGWGIGGIGIMFLTLGTAYKICTHA